MNTTIVTTTAVLCPLLLFFGPLLSSVVACLVPVVKGLGALLVSFSTGVVVGISSGEVGLSDGALLEGFSVTALLVPGFSVTALLGVWVFADVNMFVVTILPCVVAVPGAAVVGFSDLAGVVPPPGGTTAGVDTLDVLLASAAGTVVGTNDGVDLPSLAFVQVLQFVGLGDEGTVLGDAGDSELTDVPGCVVGSKPLGLPSVFGVVGSVCVEPFIAETGIGSIVTVSSTSVVTTSVAPTSG